MKKYVFSFIVLLLFTNSLFAENTYYDWINHSDAKSEMINNAGENIGTVYAKQGTQGVLLRIKLTNIKAGLHGMHFHNIGDCSIKDTFKSAGSHIDAHSKPHGFFHPQGPHEGNLPNLIVDNSGNTHIELYTQMVSIKNGKVALLDDNGSALVIHTLPDDHFTQPIGGSGERIACGVFKKTNKN